MPPCRTLELVPRGALHLSMRGNRGDGEEGGGRGEGGRGEEERGKERGEGEEEREGAVHPWEGLN